MRFVLLSTSCALLQERRPRRDWVGGIAARTLFLQFILDGLAVEDAVAAVGACRYVAGVMETHEGAAGSADQCAGAGNFTAVPGRTFLDVMLKLQHLQAGMVGNL